ncbi:MAG: ribosome maturation factor RimP, partial [Alphaproteobacteria bacterium]|nr:ribosome maturation factor RimP [Alphaproteobacteria bacterium]
MSINAKIQNIIEAPLNRLGFGVVQIKFIEHAQPKLEILIERLDFVPVTVEDCMKANRTVSTHLDVEDPIHKAYTLEVSSAGIDRPLVGIKDYRRFVGYKINIQTAVPFEGSKKFKGILEKVSEAHAYIRSEVPKLEDLVEVA